MPTLNHIKEKITMNWKLKAKIFRSLSSIPFGTQIHYLLQRHVTKEWPRRHEYLNLLLVAAKRLHKDINEHSKVDIENASFVEIGCGRDLAVAIALRLMGVGHITCVDISRQAKLFLIAHAARHMATQLGKPCPIIETWRDLEKFGITYAAPSHLSDLKLAAKSVDCFYSVDTLEHIPCESLKDILCEANRILNSKGVTIHFIDYSDHYARGSDNESARFNFLTYTDKEWSPFNSMFQYVNRMRHSQYVDLFVHAGLKPISIDVDIESPRAAVLEHLAPEFQAFDVKDLFTVRAKIVSVAVHEI